MSYEIYKLLHISMLLIFCASLGLSLSGQNTSKAVKIITGASSFLILVAGMGLLARIGVNHGEGFPGWVKAKIALWAVLSIGGPIMIKRLKAVRNIVMISMLSVMVLATYLAINKPF